MMKIVVPYVRLEAKTVIALNKSGYEFERVNVSDSDEAYWEVLDELWRDKADFCVVEQDIIVGPDTLREIDECSEPWCVCPFPYLGGIYVGLGVARFHAELMVAAPDLMDAVATHSRPPLHPPKHWCQLAEWVGTELGQRGFVPHWHEEVGHDGDGQPSHGCTSSR